MMHLISKIRIVTQIGSCLVLSRSNFQSCSSGKTEDDSEKELFGALSAGDGAISSAIVAEDFAAAMGGMAALRGPVDAFFEAVQVNAENQIVRRNRLNLLSQIRKVCAQVADLTKIEG